MKQYAVWSDSMGLMGPCQVVGRNASHVLVQVWGVTVPAEAENVFELAEGMTVANGRIVPIEAEAQDGSAPDAATVLVFSPSRAEVPDGQ